MHVATAALAPWAEATPSPTPTAPPADLVTPGVWGFVAIALVAFAVVFLVWDMMRRIRRGRYRVQVREELDAEERERDAADGAPPASSGDGTARAEGRTDGSAPSGEGPADDARRG